MCVTHVCYTQHNFAVPPRPPHPPIQSEYSMVVSVETQRYFSPPSVVAPSNDFLGFRLLRSDLRSPRSRCQRFESPGDSGWREGGSAYFTWSVVAASQCPAPAGWTATSSGCSGSSPRSALCKICANQKIGESEGKKEHHHGHHPEVQSLPEERRRRRKKMQRYLPHT